MHFRKFNISFLLLLVWFSASYTQQLALRNYTVEDGLVQSSVYSIFQDKDGYLWFGTEGGVSRFDGINFVNYTIKDGLPDNFIYSIIQDKKGNIWFGTKYGGVCKFDGKEFRVYDTTKGFISNTVYSILEEKNGLIWFATDVGLCKYDGKKFFTYNRKFGLKQDLIRTIIQDSKGNFWMAHGSFGGGITKFDGKKFINYSYNDGVNFQEIFSIFEDNSGNIWFGARQGILKFDGKNFFNITTIKNLPETMVISIFQDKYGDIWFGTYGNGIIKYANNRFSVYNDKNALSNTTVPAIYEDNRGDFWIGMYNGGVARFSAERYIYYTSMDGISNEGIFAINEFPEGVYWFGTYGGGLNKLENNKITTYTIKNGLPHDFISSMVVSKNHSLWIGTMGGISNYMNGRFRNYTINDGLVNNLVFSIIEDKNGNLWIGADGGVSKFDGISFKNYTVKDGLISKTVYSILEDSYGNYWFGTADGLSRFDGNKFTNFCVKDGLINNSVLSLCEDTEGNIWIGTDGGISVFDGYKFTSFSTKDGLSDSYCNFLYIDKNYIYIGTNKGINRLDIDLFKKGKYSFKVFSAKDGLPSSECTTGGVFQDGLGTLWFGTVKGVINYNPKNIPKHNAPPIFISEMRVMDKPVSLANDLDLKYFQNYIRFEYHSIAFASPEEITFKYKLEGVDNDWHLTNERSITYSSLKSGEYTFKVLAKNKDGIWSTVVAAKHFHINPPFYETLWFRLSLIIITILSIYTIYVIKTQQVKKRNRELAQMVKERTRELEKEKDKSDNLLQNILPVSLVEELKTKGAVQPREFKNVSILFTDFKGFTYIAAVLPAERLVNELNDIFKHFDNIIEKYALEKLKTIGDSYMVGAGLPKETEDHAIKIVQAAIEMQKYMSERNKTSAIKWEMRAGIHSGHVLAGVVGTKKFTYDIWGDTVNIASRMESAGAPGEINISAYTYMLVRDYFECEYRGKVSAKGKGELDMYFVKGFKTDIVAYTSEITAT